MGDEMAEGGSPLQTGCLRRRRLQVVRRLLRDRFAPSRRSAADEQRDDRETFHGGHFLPRCLSHTHPDKHVELL